MSPEQATQFEAIIRIAQGGLAAMSIDEIEFGQMIDAFFERGLDVGRATGILMMRAELKGLISRDHDGRWLRRDDDDGGHEILADKATGGMPSPSPNEGAEGQTTSASAAKIPLPTAPSPAHVAAMKRTRNATYSEIFAFKLVSGREIGTLRFSELAHHERLSNRDARILRRVRQHGVPISDMTVAEYFPADRLAKIVNEEGGRHAGH